MSDRLKVQRHLTDMHPPELREQLARTYEGQAYFAGTGPPDALCFNCRHWGHGFGRHRPCLKFTNNGKPVPGHGPCLQIFRSVQKKGFRK